MLPDLSDFNLTQKIIFLQFVVSAGLDESYAKLLLQMYQIQARRT